MTKEQAQQALATMPNSFHVDELIQKLVVIAQIDEGIASADAGDVVEHEEFMKEVDKWLK